MDPLGGLGKPFKGELRGPQALISPRSRRNPRVPKDGGTRQRQNRELESQDVSSIQRQITIYELGLGFRGILGIMENKMETTIV